MFEQQIDTIYSRYQLVKLLDKMTDVGLCYLVVNPYLSADSIKKLEYFIIDKDFKLKLDGNELIKMGVPKGRDIFTAKNFIMEKCINCWDTRLRDTLEFQREIAQEFVKNIQTK